VIRPVINPTAIAPIAIRVWNDAGDIAVSYSYQLPPISFSPAAIVSTPITPPTNNASRHRTPVDFDARDSVTTPAIAIASAPRPAMSAMSSFADRISL
jgi:hypothetical protein